ncbi:TetR/AcrR family transcriptional regulator [uncultured Nocardioides sp.]|uniref:TetR/AcrR family transcriptional regulator n=1 Tax=uncultured Nocardioides sp. TaxID=198441 RepID=UPI000C615CCF|nr:TetR/AcrR family transcriptional regulator [uncultured Nocardioides sp.]MAO80472.1 TetR family transcriptional regulator [Nocardioides sp.]
MKVRDQRRAALLESLDTLLRETRLEDINIADISRRAGLTRSAFYFYFESKHLAVAALMEEIYGAALTATARLADPSLPAQERVGAMVSTLFDSVEEHAHLFLATLEARGQSAALRQLWDADRSSFTAMVAEVIRDERAAGRAAPGPDPLVLASMLLDLNDRALERLVEGALPRPDLEEAIVSIWVRSLFDTPPTTLESA